MKNLCILSNVRNNFKISIKLLKLLISRFFSRKTKLMIYWTMILQVVLYTSEAWSLAPLEELEFRVIDSNVLTWTELARIKTRLLQHRTVKPDVTSALVSYKIIVFKLYFLRKKTSRIILIPAISTKRRSKNSVSLSFIF